MDDLRRTDLPLTRDAADEIDRLRALNEKLLMALQAIGALPNGYCFCFGEYRHGRKPEHAHTGECQAARTAIAKATGEGDQ